MEGSNTSIVGSYGGNDRSPMGRSAGPAGFAAGQPSLLCTTTTGQGA
jgi:hypothetical protein